MSPLKMGWLMCCLSTLMYIGSPLLTNTVIADDCSECTGWHWNGEPSGAGDGSCGICEDIVYTRTLGSCIDGDPGNYCGESSKFTRATYEYSCHPPGTAGLLGCYTLGVACGLIGGGVCVGVCFTSGVWTGGASCYACIAALLVGGGACACLVSECLCPCAYDRLTLSDYQNGCT